MVIKTTAETGASRNGRRKLRRGWGGKEKKGFVGAASGFEIKAKTFFTNFVTDRR